MNRIGGLAAGGYFRQLSPELAFLEETDGCFAACWNRLGETVTTRKKREKTGEKWARYGLKRVNQGS